MRFLLAAGLFAAGLAGGWWSWAPDVETPAAPAARAMRPRPRTHAVPDDVRLRVQAIRRAESSAGQVREIVTLATNLPLEDFRRWHEGNFLEFLDGQLEGVFYRILDERWMEADPAGCAKFMLGRSSWSVGRFLDRWVEVDEKAAVEYVRGMPGKPGDPAARGLVEAVGKHDVAKALDLMDEFGARMQYKRDVLGVLAKADREAVLAYANGLSGQDRLAALTSAAGAWIEKDFSWVVGMLEAQGVGTNGMLDLVNHLDSGKAGMALLKNAALLPEGWLDELSRGRTGPLTYGCEVEWLDLKQGVPGISDEALRRIQIQAAQTPWWYNDKRDAGLRLVAVGEWLPVEARAKIAETLAVRWEDDPEAARKWVTGLTGELKAAGEKGLAMMDQGAEQRAMSDQMKTPAGLMAAIDAGKTGSLFQVGNNWGEAEIAQAAAMAGNLDASKAAAVLDSLQMDLPSRYGLPAEVAAAIAARALAKPTTGNPDNKSRINRALEKVATSWAREDPRSAATWAEGLPAGDARIQAAKNVAIQWAAYSPSEAHAWAAKLGGTEREAVLSTLSERK
jgi:hypothetical protein